MPSQSKYPEGVYTAEDMHKAFLEGLSLIGWISLDERLPPLGERFHANHYSGVEWDHGPFVGQWDDEFRRSCMKTQGYTHWAPIQPQPN